jgi:hypothetical protein
VAAKVIAMARAGIRLDEIERQMKEIGDDGREQ